MDHHFIGDQSHGWYSNHTALVDLGGLIAYALHTHLSFESKGSNIELIRLRVSEKKLFSLFETAAQNNCQSSVCSKIKVCLQTFSVKNK